VAATSACNAWAVGFYRNVGGHSRPLVEHWNGEAWKVQQSAEPSKGETILSGVAAVSASDAWAVGSVPHPQGVMVEHWNGKAWTVQQSPPLDGELFGVGAVSASDAWMVGEDYNGNNVQTLVEHWNGKAWEMQPSPSPSGSNPYSTNFLEGVAAVSASDAWAVGYYNNGTDVPLVEHWNGKAWKVQPSPNLDGAALSAVVAVSASDAWAVGSYDNGSGEPQTLVEHWNGKAWKVQPSPDPGGSTQLNALSGVAAASASDAWAVGNYNKGGNGRTLVEHWNGKAWTVQPSPDPGGSTHFNGLSGVAAVSTSDAWAVGSYYNGTKDKTLVARWNGKAWQR
jgi:erythromycin esterase-like protein